MQTTRFVWQRLIVVLFLLTSPVAVLKAQIRAGLPTAPPDGSAALDVSGGPYPSGSEYRGIAPPKVALSKTSVSTPVSKPATGLLIYNTATVNDVTPGYYYWEGTRWLRFETASKGSARVAAAGGGQTIKAYLLSEVQNQTITDDNFILVEPGREGLFSYVAGDNSSDNGGTILVAAGNKHFKRVYDNAVSVEKWGIQLGADKSSAVRTANTAALQKAVDSGVSLFFPEGIIETNNTITVTNKAVKWYGTGQTSIVRQTNDVNLFVISNTTINYEPTIEGICFQAGAKFSTATALTIKGYPTQQTPVDVIQSKPFAHLSRLYFWGKDAYTVGAVSEWKKSIVIDNPNTMTLNDIQIHGASNSKENATVGIEMTASRASIETMVHNVKIDIVTTGLTATTSTYPGIEGLHISHCTIVGVYDGVVLWSQIVGYLPPFWTITDCHISASRINISINNSSQGQITNCLLYNIGNNNPGDDAFFILLSQCSQFNINDNRLYVAGAGANPTNDAYGILSTAGGPTNMSSYNSIKNNYFRLQTNSTKPAIWLQRPWQYSTIQGNYRENSNGAPTIMSDPLSHDNRFYDNFPPDAIEGSQNDRLLSPVNTNDQSQGNQLDLRSARASYIIMPSSQMGSINQIKMDLGQRVSIQFEGTVTVKHNLSFIRLAGESDYTFHNGDVLNLINTGIRVEETSRKLNQNSSNLLTPVFTNSLPAGNLSSSSYTEIVAPGTLANNKVYLVKLYFEESNNTVITQSYVLPSVLTYTGAADSTTPIVGNSINYNNDGKGFNLRYKKGSGTMGLEIALAPNTTGLSGNVVITIAPLL